MGTDHKMLGTDGDGQLGETVRHLGQRRAVVIVGGLGSAVARVLTDGFDGRLQEGLRGDRPSLKGAEVCASTEGDGW